MMMHGGSGFGGPGGPGGMGMRHGLRQADEEEVLGKAYDHRLVMRLVGYMAAYRGTVILSAVSIGTMVRNLKAQISSRIASLSLSYSPT